MLREGGPLEDVYDKLDDTRFTLVVLGVALPAETVTQLRAMADLFVIPSGGRNEEAFAAAGLEAGSYFLLRPDGYIGLSGRQPDAAVIERYLTSRIGLRSAAA